MAYRLGAGDRGIRGDGNSPTRIDQSKVEQLIVTDSPNIVCSPLEDRADLAGGELWVGCPDQGGDTGHDCGCCTCPVGLHVPRMLASEGWVLSWRAQGEAPETPWVIGHSWESWQSSP